MVPSRSRLWIALGVALLGLSLWTVGPGAGPCHAATRPGPTGRSVIRAPGAGTHRVLPLDLPTLL